MSAPPPHLAALLAKPAPPPTTQAAPPRPTPSPGQAPYSHLFVPAQRTPAPQARPPVPQARPAVPNARPSVIPTVVRHSTIAIPTPAPPKAALPSPIVRQQPVAGPSLPRPGQPQPQRPVQKFVPPKPAAPALAPVLGLPVEKSLPHSSVKQDVPMGDDDLYASIEASNVLAQALQRARSKWLTGAILPTFSTSAKGKSVKQTAHTVSELGKATIIAGPLIFDDTRLYQVTWAPGTPTPAPGPPKPPRLTSTASPATPANPKSVSPALIGRLSAMATTDPSLAEILRLAAQGAASQAQLQALARYISALEQQMGPVAEPAAPPPSPPKASPSPTLPSPSASPAAPSNLPTRPPCLLLEFRESSSERFVVPDLFSLTSSSTPSALSLSFYVYPPPPIFDPRTHKIKPVSPAVLLTLELTDLDEPTYDALIALGETVPTAKREAFFAELKAKEAPPTYLTLRTAHPPHSPAYKAAMEERRLAELKRKGAPIIAAVPAAKKPKKTGKKKPPPRPKFKVDKTGKAASASATPAPTSATPAVPVAGPSGTSGAEAKPATPVPVASTLSMPMEGVEKTS